MLEFFIYTLLLIISTLVIVYFYLKLFVYNYWKKHKVPHRSPSALFGNLKISLFTGQKSLGTLLWDSYKNFNKYPFHGIYIFGQPVLIISDPELIKLVLVKEFSRFEGRGWYINEKVDSLTNQIFLQAGKPWKRLRVKMSPAFTPIQLRQFFTYIAEVGDELIDTCDKELKVSDELNIYSIIGRYSIDLISSLVYGFKSSSLNNPNNDFQRLGIRAITFGRFNMLFAIFFPDILNNFNLKFYREEPRQFFTKIFTETIEHRRKEKIVKKDFINCLMQLIDKGELDDEPKVENDNKEIDDKISMTEAIAQALLFFLAGFETTTSVVTYCLLELALNPDIQEKLYQEIRNSTEKSELTCDSLLQMEYLNMVFSEAQRKYPGVAFLNRICNEDCPIPNSNYVIPKGMRVVISTLGVHYDPKYFPNPNKFDPTRFSKENSNDRSPCLNLGFGEGPRMCIAYRFGAVQSKLAIAKLIQKYKLFIGPSMGLPVKFTSEGFICSPAEEDIYLRLEPRNQ